MFAVAVKDVSFLDDAQRVGGAFNRVELTPHQAKLWTEISARLLYSCPAFAHIFYTMMNPHGEDKVAYFTDSIPTAATDGHGIYISPEFFFEKLTNHDERIFVLAHEILHGIFNHMNLGAVLKAQGFVQLADGTKLDYHHPTMNAAEDYVINDMLIEAGVGRMPKVGGLHDTSIATQDDAATEVYGKLFDDTRGSKGNDDGDHGGFDQHLDPGDGADSDQPRNEGEWKAQIAAAMQAAKLQGKLPQNLERAFNKIIDPKVPWREHIQALFARRVGSGGYNWQRGELRALERDLYIPSRSGHGSDTVVVAVDTSGSVSEQELAAFMGEMSGIIEEVKPKRLIVIWCDCRVQRIDEVEDAAQLTQLSPPQGGGTSFIPVFDEIAEMGLKPDALVYLTDGYGAFPSAAPSYPVIWGTTALAPEQYPFGDAVTIDLSE